MRLVLPMAAVALAGIAAASYAPPVPHTSHYGDSHSGGGGIHSGGSGVHIGGSGVHSGGGIHTGGSGVDVSGGGVHHGSGGVHHGSGGVHQGSGGVHTGGSGAHIVGSGIHASGGHSHGYYDLFLSFLAPETRNYEYTWEEAAYQCAKRGRVLVSIENYQKDQYIASLIRRYNVPFIWTSGTKHGYSFWWVNGIKIGSYSFSNWSPTGVTGNPQPDNREGHEYCLAVLNNHLGDGIKWHDIGCHHKKPFICEYPKSNVY